eukprot:GEMP01021148.1.p1 GENE.GEMP01021148.1~~GEMP01021148.1.p1  ORF type:complete len:651 (+),score=148.17 GEMP01021148.1:68-2020(+)
MLGLGAISMLPLEARSIIECWQGEFTHYACCLEAKPNCFPDMTMQDYCCADVNAAPNAWNHFRETMPVLTRYMRTSAYWTPARLEKEEHPLKAAAILTARLMSGDLSRVEVEGVRNKLMIAMNYHTCSCVGRGYELYKLIKLTARRIHWPYDDEHSFSSNSMLYAAASHMTCSDEDVNYQLFNLTYVVSAQCGPGEVVNNLFAAFACLVQGHFVRVVKFFVAAFIVLLASPCDFTDWNLDPNYVPQVLQQLLRMLTSPPKTVHEWQMAVRGNAQMVLFISTPSTLHDKKLQHMVAVNQPVCWVNDVLRIKTGASHFVMRTEWGPQYIQSSWNENETMPTTWRKGTVWVIAISYPWNNIWHSMQWWASAFANKPPNTDTLAVVFTRGIVVEADARQPRLPKRLLENWRAFHKPILDLIAPRVIFPNYLCNWTLSICFPRGQFGGVIPLFTDEDLHRRAGRSAIQKLRATFIAPTHRPSGVVVINRAGEPRAFANFPAVMRDLHTLVDTTVRYYDQLRDVGNIVDQLRAVASARILVGAHGAGLTWAVFMESHPLHQASCLIEIFPPGSANTICQFDAWDANNFTIYGGMARIAGVRHVCIGGDTAENWHDGHLIHVREYMQDKGLQMAQMRHEKSIIFPVQRVAHYIKECL